jgi:hypothetical protein
MAMTAGAFGDKPKGSFGDKSRARRADQREERGERSFSTPRSGFGGERPAGSSVAMNARVGLSATAPAPTWPPGSRPQREEPTPYQRIASLQDFAIDPEGERIAKLLARAASPAAARWSA